MPERIRRVGTLATSSREQDRLVESATLLFEKLQIKEQAELADLTPSKKDLTSSAKKEVQEEFQLCPRDPDARGAVLNVRLSPNPAVDALPIVGAFRKRPRENYRSSPAWRRRNKLDRKRR